MSGCVLCPRACGIDRAASPGVCGAGPAVRVAHAQLHHWEEPCLSGPDPDAPEGGSGTIFFSGCALRCVYCQNHDISMGAPGQGQPGHRLPGEDFGPADLAALMLELQLAGAHNINLVTPSHFAPQLRQALALARANGLRLPVVWNTSAYERLDALRSLEGLVDIYLPDLRYMDSLAAKRYSAAPDYPTVATHAILEMHRQVGGLALGPDGLARRGLLIRLLVLPGNPGRTDLALRWIADTLGPETAVSLMGQYYPAHRASEFPEIDRAVDPAEYDALLGLMEELGMTRGYTQQVGSSARFTPEFRKI